MCIAHFVAGNQGLTTLYATVCGVLVMLFLNFALWDVEKLVDLIVSTISDSGTMNCEMISAGQPDIIGPGVLSNNETALKLGLLGNGFPNLCILYHRQSVKR